MWSMVFFSVGEVGVVKWKKKKGWKGEGDDYGLQKSEEAERRGEGRGRGGGVWKTAITSPRRRGGYRAKKCSESTSPRFSTFLFLSPRNSDIISPLGWGMGQEGRSKIHQNNEVKNSALLWKTWNTIRRVAYGLVGESLPNLIFLGEAKGVGWWLAGWLTRGWKSEGRGRG